MSKIRLIEGYQKIAAGEVIERPASVVKELVENSLDAHADTVSITLEEAGKHLIQIVDDGDGIPADELEVAFERHTSSKIATADELEEIYTLGFRGEALASIAAVSEIELISRPSEQESGYKLVLNEGKTMEKEACGSPKGTSIKIKNLFFNLPVRHKFLKSNKVELGHITDVITRYTLAYPLIHFKLEHNGLSLINSPAWPKNEIQASKKKKTSRKPTENNESEKLEKYQSQLPLDAYGYAIQMIYGKKMLDQMFPVRIEHEYFQLMGYVGNPEVSRSDRNASSIFVNLRLVSNQGISKIVEDCYTDFLMRNKFPFFVIYIFIEPRRVDFNVHPSKKIVKFLEEAQFFSYLRTTLKKEVEIALTIRNQEILLADQKETTKERIGSTKSRLTSKSSSNSDQNKNPITNISQKNTGMTKPSPRSPSNFLKKPPKVQSTLPILNASTKTSEPEGNPQQLEESTSVQTHFAGIVKHSNKEPIDFGANPSNLQVGFIPTKNLPELHFLNQGTQAGKVYLIFQNSEGLVIIDQHAAHERINYEKVQREYEGTTIKAQQLISPIKFESAPNEVAFIQESLQEMEKLGFRMEYFGGNSFIIRQIPTILPNPIEAQEIIDICLEIISMGKEESFSAKKREIMQYLGCHQSIRAGDEIWSEARIRKLIQDLDRCQNPHHCAHGRPTYITIPYPKIDKWFHRIL